MQLLFCVSVYHIKGCFALTLIHPHIQLSIVTRRKAALRFIKLVAAYTEISNDAINNGHTMQSQKSLQVTKIVRYKNYTIIIWQILLSILILIKCYQFSIGV